MVDEFICDDKVSPSLIYKFSANLKYKENKQIENQKINHQAQTKHA
jgi:hypothetical protein